MMINIKRLTDTFKNLVKIDSVSKEEGVIAGKIMKMIGHMGATTVIDDAGKKTGSNTGNLVARFPGNKDAPPILLSAHMDTVEPGRGVLPVLKNGIFRSDGTTILGADDKSAIAIILEALNVIKEKNIRCGPVEVIFTICEEIGLLGSKNFNYDLVTAKCGYVLDSTETEGIVTRAPATNRLEFTIKGKDSHAGAFPEKGINAIWLAGKAIAGIELGRIDEETTCNLGMINGGIATNIVPDLVSVKGEVRSHSRKKLDYITNKMALSFQSVVDNYKNFLVKESLPRLESRIDLDFPELNIPHAHPVVTLALQASENIGMKMVPKKTGGGSDANIFFENGIITGVLGTGMRHVHTLRESIRIEDMVSSTALLVEILKLHSKVQV